MFVCGGPSSWLTALRLPQGFSLDWCKQPEVGLPKPDLVMFLKLSPSEAALRGQFGQERYETSVFQQAVQQKFEQLMQDPTVNWQVRSSSDMFRTRGCEQTCREMLTAECKRSCYLS